MKLELKHLAPYLPYGLRYSFDNISYWASGANETYTSERFDLGTLVRLTSPEQTSNVIGVKWDDDKNGLFVLSELSSSYHKPILRPLSDLEDNLDWLSQMTEDVNHFLSFHNGMFSDAMTDEFTIGWIPQVCFEWLVKNQFDVFGLIPSGLAISYKEAGLD